MLNVTGLSELQTALTDLVPRKVRSLMDELLRAGAEPIKAAIAANCPDDEGALCDALVISVRKTRGADEFTAQIGFNDEPHPGSTFAGGRPASNSFIALCFEFGARTGLTLRSDRSRKKKGAAEHAADSIPALHFTARAFTEAAQPALDAMTAKAAEIIAKLDGGK